MAATEPSANGVAKAMELAASSAGVAWYLKVQYQRFETKHNSPEYQKVAMSLSNFVQQVVENDPHGAAESDIKVTPVRDSWGGMPPLGTTSHECANKAKEARHFANLCDKDAQIKFEFAISDSSQLIRRWSVDGKPYQAQDLPDADGRLRTYFNTHHIDMGADGTLYKTNEHGRRETDKEGMDVKVSKETAQSLIKSTSEGLKSYFESNGRKLQTTELPFVAAPQASAKQESPTKTTTATASDEARPNEDRGYTNN